MAPASILSLEYDLVPGYSLGPFILGTTLWENLEYLREAKVSYPQVLVKYDAQNPGATPIVIHALPYIELLFSPYSQRLHTISLRAAYFSGQGTPIVLRYRNTVLATSDQPLRRVTVTKYFGPTYPGDSMKYPGIWFGFKEDREDLNTTARVLVGDGRSAEVKKVVVQQKRTEGGSFDSLLEVNECDIMKGGVKRVVAEIHRGITIYFYPNTSSPVEVSLGHSAEDLCSQLGRPLRIYYKEDDRMDIHSTTRSLTVKEGTDYFYNYFHLGMDFLISGSTHHVIKIILHSNIPGSPTFQRHARCPWGISIVEKENNQDQVSPKVFTFFDKCESLFHYLGESLSSTPLLMEVDQVEDDRLSLPNSKIQLRGFDGIVAEVSLDYILTVVLF